jgi:hypothetical protein
LIGAFDDEWEYTSVIDGSQLISGRGWTRDHLLVLDLQTGEGSIFRPGGSAKADLDKHRVWVCPMFEPFLTWLYDRVRADPGQSNGLLFAMLPQHIDLPDAEFEMSGYRRPGPEAP